MTLKQHAHQLFAATKPLYKAPNITVVAHRAVEAAALSDATFALVHVDGTAQANEVLTWALKEGLHYSLFQSLPGPFAFELNCDNMLVMLTGWAD